MINFNKYFSYNKDTGVFTWKARGIPNWDSRCAVEEAGVYRKADGYLIITINKKQYYGHRLAWIMSGNTIPKGMFIDHINGDTTDNRLSNLRLANSKQSAHNTVTKVGVSGIKNVTIYRGKYKVKISVNNKSKYLGTFDDLELAELIATEARNFFRGDFANHLCKL